MRTTLGMASFGLGMVGFFRSLVASSPTPETIRLHQGAIQFGTSLIVLGVAATVVAAWWLPAPPKSWPAIVQRAD